MESPSKKKRSEPVLTPAELTEDEDKVFLTYKGQNFEQSRQRLSKCSLFFRNLFTGEYSDSSSKHLDIKHQDAELDTFKSFLNCVNSDQSFDVIEFSVNDSVKKYEGNNFEELLQLFRLTFYFLADDLLSCLSYIIVSNWFKPMYILEIWLMAESLACENLQKAAFAMCLDIFEIIPQDLLFALPMVNFKMIIQNANIRCSETYFKDVLSEWAQKNNVTGVEKETIISKFKNAENNKSSRYLHCVTGFTIPECGDEALVFTWDGNELEELSKIADGLKRFALAGSQILGRGYSIYVVGGEKCIGKGSFNKSITRYCLLTKRWYKVASLLVPRRHMVATFLGNKLVLAGGVGIYRIKLSSVQILDIHTATWTHGPDVPHEFTENPPACVFGNQLLIAMSDIYSYKLHSRHWEIVWENRSTVINNMMCCNKELYVVAEKSVEPVIYEVYMIEQTEASTSGLIVHLPLMNVRKFHNFLSVDNRLVWFTIINHGELVIEVGEFLSSTVYNHLQRKLVRINDKIRFKPYIGCFNILNPKALISKLEDEAN